MTHVATLISSASAAALDAELLRSIQAALPAADAPQWLAQGIAADVSFIADAAADNKSFVENLKAIVGRRPIDVVVQAAASRRKKLLVADMDSTMIGQECIDELADFAGLKSRIAAITERAMRGEIAFEAALRERVGLLKSLPASMIEQVIAERIRPNAGAQILVSTMRAQGAHTCLVSGGFTAFTARVAAMIGFNEARANTLLIDSEGRIAGVAEPILGREAKRQALEDLRLRLKLEVGETLAVGDGANDLAMLEAAGLGVAFHAKPVVAAAASARIDHADLTALLYLQGYRREEFAAGQP